MSKLKVINLNDIRENKVALRTVDQSSEKFQQMVASMTPPDGRVLNPIVVRERKAEDGKKYYEIIEGLHRTTSARAAGLVDIPANIIDADDSQVMEAQVIGNLIKVDTKPVEFTNQLKRYLSMNPLMTEAEVARKFNVSVPWIQARLSLTKVTNEKIQSLIDDGSIKLANAYCLAKLPEDEQRDFLEGAMQEGAEEFAARVTQRVKEINDERRKGRAEQPKEFSPVPHLRKIKEAQEEIANGLPSAKEVCKKAKTPVEGMELGIRWMLHLDPISLAEQKAKYDAIEAERKERAEKRKQEIAKRKADKAALAAKEAANAQAKMSGEELPHPELETEGEGDEG